MARAVVQHHQATHEDFTIVSFNPLPANILHFPAVHEVVHEFLEGHVSIRDIQPSHLGQALVRFVHVHDRDSLVNNSPHPYGEVNFNLVRHNQGRNWRAMNFNRDCWLMLLGFPLDHWNNVSIQSAIASFGKVVIWENDRTNLARLLVRAQVTDLQDVPHFIVLSESEGFLGHSWTVQCEILEQQLQGNLVADEESAPELGNIGHAPMFDFFLALVIQAQLPSNYRITMNMNRIRMMPGMHGHRWIRMRMKLSKRYQVWLLISTWNLRLRWPSLI
jgi:hypothetical protein